MDKKFIQVEFQVRQMQTQLLQYFTGFEDLIKQAVEDAISPQNLIEMVLKEVNATLAWKIRNALQEVIEKKIRDDATINRMVADVISTQLAKQSKPKKQRKPTPIS